MGVRKYKSNNIRGKLKVCHYLRSNPALRRYVPKTVLFTKKNLQQMMDQFSTLYIKPNIGSQGIGIYKVEQSSDGYTLKWTYQKKQKKKTFTTRQSLIRHLSQKFKKKMIIQRAITLDKVNGRPYDIRVMVQRKPKGPWTCTGFLIKVGSKQKIVTNYYQGGKIYSLRRWLSEKRFSPEEQHAKVHELTDVALKVSKTLSSKRKGMREMGIDFAYSTNQKLWILEVNTNHPQFYPLKRIDREAYDRMMSFARSYGRRDA